MVRELPDLSRHLDTYRRTISRLKDLATPTARRLCS
jgi:hypothetical protein